MKDRITYTIIYSFGYLLSLLPISVLYFIAGLMYYFNAMCVRYRYDVVVQNISRSFPDFKYEEIRNTTKQFYRAFFDNFAEQIKAISIPGSVLSRKVEFVDFDKVVPYLNSGKNVFLYLGHCGNWEMLNVFPHATGMPLAAVYKPLSNKGFDRLMHKIRSRFGVVMVEDKHVARRILSGRKGEMYMFLADQCPNVLNDNYRFEFLHQQSYFFPGVEKLSRLKDAPVFYIHVERKSRGKYIFTLVPVADNSKEISETEITAAYVNLLEKNIREFPSDWLWSHKRWKR